MVARISQPDGHTAEVKAVAATSRILVVDDEPLIVATLSQGLEQAGYDVITTLSGEEAVQICERQSPDLAILDVRIPDISGLDAARCIRDRTEVPFLFLSAYGDKATVDAAVEQGALGYLVKPIDVTQLVPAVEAALARAADLRELQRKEANLHSGMIEGRTISVAVGLLMERYHIGEETAFDVLRAEARSRRCKVLDLTTDISQAFNTLATLRERVFKLKEKRYG